MRVAQRMMHQLAHVAELPPHAPSAGGPLLLRLLLPAAAPLLPLLLLRARARAGAGKGCRAARIADRAVGRPPWRQVGAPAAKIGNFLRWREACMVWQGSACSCTHCLC